MDRSIVVLASGSGSDLQSILDAIERGWIEHARVTQVISDKREAFALERATAAGATALCVPPVPKAEGGREAHDGAIRDAIVDGGGADLVVLAGYMRILSPVLVDAFEDRLINIHPALLPSFPGADGPGATLAGGARIAGCTTHFVDHGVDTGPIILQGAVPVRTDDDRDTLHQRILALEHQILPRTVDLFLAGRIERDGSHVRIRPGPSWSDRVQTLPDALYPDAF